MEMERWLARVLNAPRLAASEVTSALGQPHKSEVPPGCSHVTKAVQEPAVWLRDLRNREPGRPDRRHAGHSLAPAPSPLRGRLLKVAGIFDPAALDAVEPTSDRSSVLDLQRQ